MAEIAQMEHQATDGESNSNGLTNGVSNGTTNGHSHSSDSSKSRDKDRHKSSHKDKDRDRHSSSHKSSHKDRDKDKDRHRSSSSGDKHKSSHRDKDKHKSSSSSSDRDKHKSSSSSDKDKHRSSSSSGDKDKHRERSDKERSDKHKSSSSSSSKDKERHSSSNGHKESSERKDKERSDKDKHRDKDRHHSSSSKSSHKDKHRDKDRHRDKHRDEKRDKERSSSSKRSEHSTEIKEEPMSGADTSQDSMNTSMFGANSSLETSQDSTINNTGYGSQQREEEHTVKEETNSVESEEEENKLVINVKEEQPSLNHSMDTSQENADDDVPLASRKSVKKELDSDEDDVPLASRKRMKYEPEDSEDDVPISARKKAKAEVPSDDDDDVPLAARKKPTPKKKKRKHSYSDEDSEEDFKPKSKKVKVKKEVKPAAKAGPKSRTSTGKDAKSPLKKVKKESEEEKNVWKWWEEEKADDGRKWTSLEHKGVVFADPYEPLPSNVQMKYDGKYIALSQDAEEVAGFYARMLEHDYVTKDIFNKNFFKDFRKVMTTKERELITDLSKCDFKKMHTYFLAKNEERKNRTKEEKKALKEKNEECIKEFGWCIIDGHKQRIGNFKAEPPGLFRGRGDHPKMGMLKKRLRPEDVIINCSKDSNIPKPPEGHKWKEVRHDNQVTWLACWTENVQGQTKYVMMNAASKLKGEKDWMKYETARRLHQVIDKIRDQYKLDWKSKEMRIRQRAVALYFIDKLALRAGNEKDEDQADTVGCCSLRVEHITLYDEKDGKECVVAFDFLGKDSIRYYNEVPVEKRVFKNLKLFIENKSPGDDLFDRLNTAIMNKHLNDLMEGLTAKVFRTYNASRTLQEQLKLLTVDDDAVAAKMLSYNRANREVAILCNHQRAVPKTFDQSMANLQKKIDDKKKLISDAEKDLKTLKKQAKSGGSMAEKAMADKKKKQLDRLNEQLHKLEISATDKEENKQIALGTSKLNYLDPRISVAWAKMHDIPIEKVYNKTQRLKFQWAIEMATEDYDFTEPPTSKPQAKIRTNESMEEDEEEEEYED